MEGGSTATLKVTGTDAATLAKVLRKTDSMPLHKLCAQIRHENYRDWAKWERGLDFRQTMQGRYGLQCPDQASFTFTKDGANAHSTDEVAVSAYWRVRMTQALAPESVPATPVDDLPLFSAADERRALAQDCAQDLRHELRNILERCDVPSLTTMYLERSYDTLAQEIHDAETWLGFSLGLRTLQLQVECVLMARD